MRYYRVEAIDHRRDEMVGGYISAIDLIMKQRFGITSDEEPIEAIHRKFQEAADNDAELFLFATAFFTVSCIPIPPEYKQDSVNRFCLLKSEVFEEVLPAFHIIDHFLTDITDDGVDLRLKVFNLKKSELLYEDSYQVVISKDVYDMYKGENEYILLPV
ncbi:MAG: hypothetical protein K6G12_09795 [Lachnospiraceae bacterium]|nr:hypothetical protein [Lachnospiraceae bacterium]